MSIRRSIRGGLVAGIVAFAVIAPADAAQVVTSRAAFLAATAGVTIDDFEENATGGFTAYGSSYAGSGFTVAGSNLFTVDPAYVDQQGLSPFQFNSGDVLDLQFAVTTITVAAGIRAVGFDLGDPDDFPSSTGFVTINGIDYALPAPPISASSA